jgi:hypothetical protein
MALLASMNVLGTLKGYPLYTKSNFEALLGEEKAPAVTPSIVNAKELKPSKL